MAYWRQVEPNNENHRQLPPSPAERPLQHFFKIILASTLEEKKLRIPDKFVRKFGDELSDVASFTIPNGCDWKVGLTRAQNDIWFDDGWHDFVQHHSICKGSFLVFGYKGFSNFSVLIFDTTACEIKYPNNDEGSFYGEKCLIHHEIEMENNNSVDIMGSAIPSPYSNCSSKSKVFDGSATKGQSSKRCTPAEDSRIKKQCRGVVSTVSPNIEQLDDTRSKKLKMEELAEIINVDNVNESRRRELSEHRMSSSHGALVTIKDSSKSKVELGDNELPDKCEEDVDIITSEMFNCTKVSPETERAIQAAKMFKPKNPSFMVLLRSYNFQRNVLYVPAQFARRSLNCIFKSIKLQDSDGREWVVRLVRHESGRVNLGSGWNVCWRENKLKGGDVCVFELIDNAVLKISMFRANELPANCEEDTEIITCEMFNCTEVYPESEKAIQAARKFKPKNPSLMVLMQPYHFHCSVLYVPVRFARRYISGVLESIKLQDSDGRKWAVSLVQNASGCVQLGAGWKACCRENKLKAGDVCVLELIGNDVLKMSIFRANELPASCEEDIEIITNRLFECAKVPLESESAIQAARMLKPKNPSFMVLLRPNNCHYNILHVPAQFARKYFRGVNNIKLEDSDGREWKIRLSGKHGWVGLGSGWKAFCRENKLEGGEVCVFELINYDALKIYMFRAV